jgi:uncharacterized Zn finger protein
MQNQCSADAARIRRGIDLAKAGAVRQAGDLFLVDSSDGQQTYTVSLDNINGETCSCPDWRHHGFGHVCKHVAGTTYALAKGLCRSAKTAKPKTGQRHKAEADSPSNGARVRALP